MEANQVIADGRSDFHCVEYRAKNRKGEWIWVRCRGYLERDEDGGPGLFAGFITNLGQKNKIDHVTGLFNKLKFEEDIEFMLESGRTPPAPARPWPGRLQARQRVVRQGLRGRDPGA